ncbi:hypothetical protein FQN53_000315 [Emmonsiellopsis sp. PD_33]|nr:hypothetical protein FQN53_000315 [Emmonsiellopsis sp. PD_33]
MSTILPLWPHIVFAILEPISLFAGFYVSLFNVEKFVVSQTPNSPTPAILPPSTQAIAFQLGNLYLLLLLAGIGILYSTSEPKVIRNYLIALAVADLGHIYATYLGLGFDDLINVRQWNDMAWGNVGASGILFLHRIAYLLGAFGDPKTPGDVKKIQ